MFKNESKYSSNGSQVKNMESSDFPENSAFENGDEFCDDSRSVEEVPQPYRKVFAEYQGFNTIQSKVLDDVFYTDKSIVLSAPTGSGKTVIFELAIIRLLITYSGKSDAFKIVYIGPMKALCEERLIDWNKKFADFGINCICVTGDSEKTEFQDLCNHNLIITTPEKWDCLTRRWKDNKNLVKVIKLFMIDEIHLLNEGSRGSTLEAVVCRMKTIEKCEKNQEGNTCSKIRFITVSATFSNIEDLADWLGKPSDVQYFKFSDEYRPVKLNKIVLGYPYNPKLTAFKFDLSLNYKLSSLLLQYAHGKPTLIFCGTRRIVEMTANHLVKNITINLKPDQKQRLLEVASKLSDAKVKETLIHGVGYHHAGMLSETRRAIEKLFRNNELPILVTTSTLAMGVNLPAHLVIIKSTKAYINGMFQDYSETALLQMVGRAGRPQFDTTATALILTTNKDKEKFEKMVGGLDFIESNLHKHLAEHLNAEVVLQTITDLEVAMRWLTSTFLYIRAHKNPKHYGMSLQSHSEQIGRKLLEMCQIELNKLVKDGMLTMNQDVVLKPTETGILMAKYYLDYETMKLFTQMTGNEILQQILNLISKCHEFSEMYLRVNDKKCLNLLNRCRNRQTIRFPLNGKIRTLDMKINCVIQAVLGCLDICDHSLLSETLKIMRNADRIVKCLIEYLESKNRCFRALLNAIIIAKCFHARLWENSPYVSKQLSGIGAVMSSQLADAGKTTFKSILECDAREIEMIINRKPPVGSKILEYVKYLPQYSLKLELYEGKTFRLTIRLENILDMQEKSTVNYNSLMHLLVGDFSNNILLYEKFTHSFMLENPEVVKCIDVKNNKLEEIEAHFISDDWVGIDCSAKYENPNWKETTKRVTEIKMAHPDKQKHKTKGSSYMQKFMDEYVKCKKSMEQCTTKERKPNNIQMESEKHTIKSDEVCREKSNVDPNTEINICEEMLKNNDKIIIHSNIAIIGDNVGIEKSIDNTTETSSPSKNFTYEKNAVGAFTFSNTGLHTKGKSKATEIPNNLEQLHSNVQPTTRETCDKSLKYIDEKPKNLFSIRKKGQPFHPGIGEVEQPCSSRGLLIKKMQKFKKYSKKLTHNAKSESFVKSENPSKLLKLETDLFDSQSGSLWLNKDQEKPHFNTGLQENNVNQNVRDSDSGISSTIDNCHVLADKNEGKHTKITWKSPLIYSPPVKYSPKLNNNDSGCTKIENSRQEANFVSQGTSSASNSQTTGKSEEKRNTNLTSWSIISSGSSKKNVKMLPLSDKDYESVDENIVERIAQFDDVISSSVFENIGLTSSAYKPELNLNESYQRASDYYSLLLPHSQSPVVKDKGVHFDNNQVISQSQKYLLPQTAEPLSMNKSYENLYSGSRREFCEKSSSNDAPFSQNLCSNSNLNWSVNKNSTPEQNYKYFKNKADISYLNKSTSRNISSYFTQKDNFNSSEKPSLQNIFINSQNCFNGDQKFQNTDRLLLPTPENKSLDASFLKRTTELSTSELFKETQKFTSRPPRLLKRNYPFYEGTIQKPNLHTAHSNNQSVSFNTEIPVEKKCRQLDQFYQQRNPVEMRNIFNGSFELGNDYDDYSHLYLDNTNKLCNRDVLPLKSGYREYQLNHSFDGANRYTEDEIENFNRNYGYSKAENRTLSNNDISQNKDLNDELNMRDISLFKDYERYNQKYQLNQSFRESSNMPVRNDPENSFRTHGYNKFHNTITLNRSSSQNEKFNHDVNKENREANVLLENYPSNVNKMNFRSSVDNDLRTVTTSDSFVKLIAREKLGSLANSFECNRAENKIASGGSMTQFKDRNQIITENVNEANNFKNYYLDPRDMTFDNTKIEGCRVLKPVKLTLNKSFDQSVRGEENYYRNYFPSLENIEDSHRNRKNLSSCPYSNPVNSELNDRNIHSESLFARNNFNQVLGHEQNHLVIKPHENLFGLTNISVNNVKTPRNDSFTNYRGQNYYEDDNNFHRRSINIELDNSHEMREEPFRPYFTKRCNFSFPNQDNNFPNIVPKFGCLSQKPFYDRENEVLEENQKSLSQPVRNNYSLGGNRNYQPYRSSEDKGYIMRKFLSGCNKPLD